MLQLLAISAQAITKDSFWIKLDTGLLLAILALGLELYRQWLQQRKKYEEDVDKRIAEEKKSSRERAKIEGTLSSIQEKLEFVLNWISSNSSFR